VQGFAMPIAGMGIVVPRTKSRPLTRSIGEAGVEISARTCESTRFVRRNSGMDWWRPGLCSGGFQTSRY
jgi:hypothetical protein